MKIKLGLLAIAIFVTKTSLAAANYPDRPIRFVVPFPPGGATDIFSRTVGEKLAEIVGKQVVVDNRSGAQGSLGSKIVANAPADGYTILFAHQGALTINPHVYQDVGYDTNKDFIAIAMGAVATPMLVVNPSVPAKNIEELISLAKRQPGRLTFASTSSGQQLVGELFKIATATDIRHIPYKGGAPAILDLVAGNVTMMFASVTTVLAQVNVGKLRPIFVLSSTRNSALPTIPTSKESGYPELAAGEVWYGVVAPAKTHSSRTSVLSKAILSGLNSPEVVRRLTSVGLSVTPSAAQEFGVLIKADFERWGKVVKTSGLKVN